MPSAEPTVTLEPTATPTPEPTATPEPTETPESATADEAGREGKQTDDITVTVLVDMPEEGIVPEGATINFTAMVQGADAAEVTFQWQFSRDNEHWEDIEGANGQSYDVVMTAANAECYWRVIVGRAYAAQEEEA